MWLHGGQAHDVRLPHPDYHRLYVSMRFRIATWNCYRGEAQSRAEFLWRLGAEIAILQECGQPEAEHAVCGWNGPRPAQGVAILTTGRFQLAHSSAPLKAGTYGISGEVSGPVDLRVMGIWAHRSRTPAISYVQSVLGTLGLHDDLLQQPVVIAGDFNSNAIWNGTRKRINHATLVARLAEMGLVSAYHEFFGESHGSESRPTHYFLRDEGRPFHIDYCFVPREWIGAIRAVEVGSYLDWRDQSDHMPLIVELDLGALMEPT